MTSHNITRKSARFICPLLLLFAPICGCGADGSLAANELGSRLKAAIQPGDGPTTQRYWNQVLLELKNFLAAEERIEKATYIFADRDVDGVRECWTFAVSLRAIPTERVDPELVNATREIARVFESVTVAAIKADRAGQKSLAAAANMGQMDLNGLPRRLSDRYNLPFLAMDQLYR
jgi:hypothetical protein